MKNLDRKTLLQSTVFKYGILVDLFASILHYNGGITGTELLATIMTGLALYAAKEGIAKGSEAYRDRAIT